MFVLGGPGSGKGTQVSPLTFIHCQHASLTNISWPMTVFIITHLPNINVDDHAYMS